VKFLCNPEISLCGPHQHIRLNIFAHMQRLDITSSVLVYDSENELPAADLDLLKAARGAALKAYAPYSQFQVGAAALLKNGAVIIGSNQENVASPSGLCAERVAVFAAGAQHPDVPVKAIAVSCRSEKFHVDYPATPCGACRQAMAEYENRYGEAIRIILAGAAGPVYVLESIAALLPLQFKADQLKK